MGRKANTAEIEARVNAVVDMLLEGKSRHYIIRFAADNWGVKTRMVEHYLQRAYDVLKDHWSLHRQEFVSMTLSRYEQIYDKAMNCNQLSAAVGALAAASRMANADGSHSRG